MSSFNLDCYSTVGAIVSGCNLSKGVCMLVSCVTAVWRAFFALPMLTLLEISVLSAGVSHLGGKLVLGTCFSLLPLDRRWEGYVTTAVQVSFPYISTFFVLFFIFPHLLTLPLYVALMLFETIQLFFRCVCCFCRAPHVGDNGWIPLSISAKLIKTA